MDYFLENDGACLTKNSSRQEILDAIDNYLAGCDDCIYYNFTADEVYVEIIDELLERLPDAAKPVTVIFPNKAEFSKVKHFLDRAKYIVKEN